MPELKPGEVRASPGACPLTPPSPTAQVQASGTEALVGNTWCDRLRGLRVNTCRGQLSWKDPGTWGPSYVCIKQSDAEKHLF